jgi:hypothetical protein
MTPPIFYFSFSDFRRLHLVSAPLELEAFQSRRGFRQKVKGKRAILTGTRSSVSGRRLVMIS